MKKIKSIVFLFLATTVALLTACSTDVEPLDPALLGDLPSENPGTNPGTPSGDYWPMVVNNTWVYKNNGVTEPPMKIISSEQISGKTYFKYSNFVGTTAVQGLGFTGTVWTRKENGTYFIRQEATIPAQGGNPAISVLPTEVEILKDNLEVNQTWTQTFTQTTVLGGIPIPSEVQILGKVLEKNVQLTVNGQAFTDVIKVQVTQNTQGVSQSNFYWFAKNIGLVKFQNEFTSTQTSYEIVSYNLN